MTERRKEKTKKLIVRLMERVARWLRCSLAMIEREEEGRGGYKSKIWSSEKGDRVWIDSGG